ncbi:MAG: sulfate transporter CysZ [Piscirickettsiaceae bacterium]|nr:MAG: sulfate transporter CysZ [Piscirickettsiaceae bacterium]
MDMYKSRMHSVNCYFSGLGLIFKPGIRRYVFIPLFINSLLFSLASWLLWTYLSSVLDDLLPSWLEWLSWLLMPIFSIISLSLVYFCFTLVANLIAAPFYAHLSRSVEVYLRGEEVEQDGTSSLTLMSAVKVIGSELRKVSYYLIRAIPLLLLSIIPGVNVVALPLWLLFSAWFLTFDYTGYYHENHQVLFHQQKSYMSHDRLNHLLFGLLSLFATSIPVLNLFSPAIAVAGATKMLVEKGVLRDSRIIN